MKYKISVQRVINIVAKRKTQKINIKHENHPINEIKILSICKLLLNVVINSMGTTTFLISLRNNFIEKFTNWPDIVLNKIKNAIQFFFLQKYIIEEQNMQINFLKCQWNSRATCFKFRYHLNRKIHNKAKEYYVVLKLFVSFKYFLSFSTCLFKYEERRKKNTSQQ